MRVGVIGLGAMGFPIAANLIAAGHSLTVYNRTAKKADALVKQGAIFVSEPIGTAACDVVITMLANDEALSEVVFGGGAHDGKHINRGPAVSSHFSANSFLAHQGADTIHISMSTVSVKLIRQISEESARLNKKFISAPVMGRPDVAKAAQLIVMPAGNADLIERCQPVFAAISKSVNVIGDKPEQANLFKLACNFMISSMIETFAEAFALVRANDIDQYKLLDIMGDKFFQSPIYRKYGQIIADGNFETGAFTVAAQEKDTRLALEAAIDSKVPMPFCTVIENAFLSAIGRGKGHLDPCAIAEVAAENAGLK